MRDYGACDRCGATIVYDGVSRWPSVFQFVFPDGDDPLEHRVVSRTLCTDCEGALLEWIDDGADGQGKVDLPRSLTTARYLREAGEDMVTLADELQERIEGDDD